MLSSWVKRKGTTQVMYIAKLKDGPKTVKKTFSMILKGVFEMVWWWGRKWNHIKKKILMLQYFSLLRILTSPLFEETLGAFLFLPLLFFLVLFFSDTFLFFFLCSLPWRFWWCLRRKITSSKISFQMKWYDHHYGYTRGGCIFQNGVKHANIAKPWLWIWESYGYIGGGRIF
jgi:hypothetical protein